MELSDIKSVFVHWSESSIINDALGYDEEGDINKEVDPVEFDELLKFAAAGVGSGYDKTVLTVEFNNGEEKINEVKFYLIPEKDGLLKLIDQ